eukprot:scaffold1220_cov259-Pinguiococcus_pyrenoidosus.AAC.33
MKGVSFGNRWAFHLFPRKLYSKIDQIRRTVISAIPRIKSVFHSFSSLSIPRSSAYAVGTMSQRRSRRLCQSVPSLPQSFRMQNVLFSRQTEAPADVEEEEELRMQRSFRFAGRDALCIRHDPSVYLVREFLTAGEIRHLLRLAKSAVFKRSYTDGDDGQRFVNEQRTSTFFWFGKSQVSSCRLRRRAMPPLV